MGLAISQKTGHWLLYGPPSCTSYVNPISRGATPPLQNEAGEISQNCVFRTTPWGTRVGTAPTGVTRTEVCQEEARHKSRPQKAKGMQNGLGIRHMLTRKPGQQLYTLLRHGEDSGMKEEFPNQFKRAGDGWLLPRSLQCRENGCNCRHLAEKSDARL